MPLYEYHCVACDQSFEVLGPVAVASRKQHCPECGRLSPRAVSAFAIGASGSRDDAPAVVQTKSPAPAPLCLRNPHVPLLCHMDQPSAKRWLAHLDGRGAEYDDKSAARSELRKKRGESALKAEEPVPHTHNFRRHAAAASHAGRRSSDHAADSGASHGHDHNGSHRHHHGADHHSH